MSDSRQQRFESLIARARQADGHPPFSDGALVELQEGTRELIWLDDAAAIANETSAEFVVDPDHRGSGQGTAMLSLLQRDRESLRVWAHGDHPAARRLAASRGFVSERTLLHMHAPVTSTHAGLGPWVTVFTEADTEEWLALNARTFAHHPEQGAVTRESLAVTMSQPWFSAADFLVLREHKKMVAYSWMKIEGSIGEFYVVGVDPERRGSGLGRRMVEAGFAHLADNGIRSAHLYVESDNIPGIRLYQSMGFAVNSVDVQYAWTAPR